METSFRLLLLGSFVATLVPAASLREDGSVVTTSIRTPAGAQIRIDYEALRWDEETFALLGSTSLQEDDRLVREYYIKYITPRVARLTTNIALRGPDISLGPGTYRIGFTLHGTEWWFVAGNEKGTQAETPVPCTSQPFQTGHLTFLLAPGALPDTLQLIVLYGPHSAAFNFTLSGEPILTTESEPPLYKRYFGGVRGEEVSPATPETPQKDWRLRTLRTREPKSSRPSLVPDSKRGSSQ